MADSYKDIIITPNRSNTADPKIDLRGGNSSVNTAITVTVYPDSNGTLSFDGSAGQLFSITNDLSGLLWSVNDVSGIPSAEVYANGSVRLAEFSGNVSIGTATNSSKLFVNGNTTVNGAVISLGDMRAPIFYDSANTSFYLDPASTGTSLFVRGEIQNPSVWINDGDNFNNYNENIRLFDAPNGVSVIAFSASGTGGTPTTSILGFGSYMERRFQTGWQDRMYNGYVEASGSYRAPIFYDSANTSFYVDPASGSNLAGQVQINGGTAMTGAWNRSLYLAATFPVIVMNSANTKVSGIGVDYTESQSGMVFWVNGNSADLTNGSATAALRINTGNFVVANDVRATVFYDSNDTAYFTNPNGRSRLASMDYGNGDYYFAGGDWGYRHNTPSGWIQFGPANSFHAHIFTDRPNFYFNAQLSVNGGSNINTSDIRANIFYDNQNTAYYVDPNNYSNLYRVNMGNQKLHNTPLVSYVWDGATLSFPWSKIATLGGTGILQFELTSKTDSNFIPFEKALVSIGTYDGVPSFSIKMDGLSSYDGMLSVLIDNSNNVWVRSIASWNSFFNYRVLHNDGNTIYEDSIAYQNATPTGIVLTSGQQARGTQGAASSASVGFSTNRVGCLTAQSRVDAPIFYDSANTSFYVDPASTSILNTLTLTGSTHYIATDKLLLQHDGSHSYIRSMNAGSHLYLGGSNQNTVRLDTGNFLFSQGSVRSPIFYDSDNTGYYVDAASTTNLNLLNVVGGNVVKGDGSAGRSTSSSNMNSLSDPSGFYFYDNPTGAPTAEWYNWINSIGNSWTSPSRYGFQIAHSFWDENKVYIRRVQDGVFQSWRRLFHEGSSDVRSGIFYDSNNTSYYLDATSTTSLRTAGSWRSDSAAWDGEFAGKIQYHSNNWYLQAANEWIFRKADSNTAFYVTQGGIAGATNDFRAPIFYDSNDTGYYVDPNGRSRLGAIDTTGAAYNIFRTWTDLTGYHGLYSSAHNAAHFYPNNGSYGAWKIDGNRNGWNGIEFGSTTNGTVSLMIGLDSATTGFHNNTHSWQFRWLAGTLYCHKGTYGGGTEATVWDSAQGSYTASTDFRAPIFYDSNNTAYYVNPLGTSNLLGNVYIARDGVSNDTFGGLEIRENTYAGAGDGEAQDAPGINFHWSNRAAARIYMNSGGNFVLGGQSDITNNRRQLYLSDLIATGNVTAYFSDERLKTKIGDIPNAVNIIQSLNGFRYVNNDTAKEHGYESDAVQIGLSAQEVQAVLPEIVELAGFDIDINSVEKKSKTGENYLTVDYSKIVPVLIEAIKEQQEHINRLEVKINSLQQGE